MPTPMNLPAVFSITTSMEQIDVYVRELRNYYALHNNVVWHGLSDKAKIALAREYDRRENDGNS